MIWFFVIYFEKYLNFHHFYHLLLIFGILVYLQLTNTESLCLFFV